MHSGRECGTALRLRRNLELLRARVGCFATQLSSKSLPQPSRERSSVRGNSSLVCRHLFSARDGVFISLASIVRELYVTICKEIGCKRIGHVSLRFRLRTFIAALSVFIVWLGLQANRFHRERGAVAEIERSDGVAGFDFQLQESVLNDFMPTDLLKFLGSVRAVEMNPNLIGAGGELGREMRPEINDEILDSISQLRSLQYLGLGATGVTDKGIVKLESLSMLREIDLSYSLVTETGIRRLKSKLPNVIVRY